MSLGNIFALVALAVPVLGAGYHYKYVHLPDFVAVEAETNYARCVRECLEVCVANGVEQCNCDNCLKYIQGE